MKTAQRLEPGAVNLARRLLALIALFVNAIDERRLGVAIMIAAICGGKLAIDVDDHAGLMGARPGFIAGKNARCGGRDRESFFLGEKSQRHFNGAGLSVYPAGLAIERVNQKTA